MIENEIQLCSSNYQKWKNLALSSSNFEEIRKALERAFFWVELQAAYITLWSVEQTRGDDPEVKSKIILAKVSICRKLAEYAQSLLNEVET